ncbi:flavin reductase family protein [Pontibacillus sp. HMF3514]|uniref:flavin reductase family protein n=1 Tax=Pontibacillus sp. HMF3514 TaxID=2692425 RepID=UPI00131F5A09|nr:flavin reductase family protein [Pontibacillus sp. HMF3514]QHE51889.1 flavin reductase family protein [Pontibacillus sp. HMF3514]
MIQINPKDKTGKDNYKLLSGSVIPRPIAFITSKNGEGIVNAAPFSFFNVVTATPPLISVSVGRREGKTVKHTAQNIIENEEFVVHIVDESYMEDMNQTSGTYDKDVSEIDQTNLRLVNSEMVDVPGIKQAKVRMECKLHRNIPLGGSDDNGCDLIIGEVVLFHFDEAVYQDGKIDAEALDAIGRLAGSDYAKLGKKISIPRPE